MTGTPEAESLRPLVRQNGFDGLQQFSFLKWLIDDNVCAKGGCQRRGISQGRIRRAARYDHDRDLITGPSDLLQKCDPVHFWHPNIADNGVKTPRAKTLERTLTGSCFFDGMADVYGVSAYGTELGW